MFPKNFDHSYEDLVQIFLVSARKKKVIAQWALFMEHFPLSSVPNPKPVSCQSIFIKLPELSLKVTHFERPVLSSGFCYWESEFK